jgi:hypothetical protein
LELLLREKILWEKSIQYINDIEKVRGRENKILKRIISEADKVDNIAEENRKKRKRK